MAAFRALTVLSVCLIGYSLAQNCDQALKDFGECLKENFKQSGGSGQGKPNVADLKQKAEKCFSDNGCDAPQKPTGGPGGFTHPPGGRAGRVDNDQRRQCFGAVSNKTKDAMLQCMRKSDPSFSFPIGGHDGASEHGHFGGDHDGGHGAPQGAAANHPGGDDFMTKACKNNAANAQKAKDCLKGLFPQKPVTPGNGMQGFCVAKKACDAKLGACKDILEKRRQAMCSCGNELQSKRDELMKSEPACASFQQNANKRPAPQHKPRDCTPKADPCAGH